jgi:hypothetical protein
MSVTKDSIKQLVGRYRAYGKNPTQIDLKLIQGIAKGLQQTGGQWEFDGAKPVISCFEGLTKLCWHFSITKAGDAATAYNYFVLENYNLWYHLPIGEAKDSLRIGSHHVTDTLGDWTVITREIAPRNAIFQQAINVTSGMFGQSATTDKSEALWNGRL